MKYYNRNQQISDKMSRLILTARGWGWGHALIPHGYKFNFYSISNNGDYIVNVRIYIKGNVSI